MKKQSKRATFEDVNNAQKEFRKLLDNLIEENRPLRDIKERNRYFNLLAMSSLGIGNELKEQFCIMGGNGFCHILGDYEYVAGWMAYQENVKVLVGKHPDEEKIDIYKIWSELRNMFLKVRGYALKLSAKISAEQVKLSRSSPAEL